MRDHLRALLITAHLLVIGVLALPQPGGFMRERDWAGPEYQDAFRSVAGALRAVGLDAAPADVQAVAWDAGMGWKRLRGGLVGAATPYVKLCGVKQGWSMFAHVEDRSGRLEVEVERGGVWEPVYISQDPARDWRGTELRQERLRAFISDFSWRRRKAAFPSFVDALASRAAGDFPEATRLRARMRTLHIPAPAALRAAGGLEAGAPYFETTVDLEAWR